MPKIDFTTRSFIKLYLGIALHVCLSFIVFLGLCSGEQKLQESIPSKGVIKKVGADHGFLGVRFAQVTDQTRKVTGFSDKGGSFVLWVVPGSPAHMAGIKRNDIILQIDGKQVVDYLDVSKIARTLLPGQKTNIKVFRGGKELSLSITIGSSKNRNTEALRNLSVLLAKYKKLYGENSLVFINTLASMADVYLEMGNWSQASRLAQRVVTLTKKTTKIEDAVRFRLNRAARIITFIDKLPDISRLVEIYEHDTSKDKIDFLWKLGIRDGHYFESRMSVSNLKPRAKPDTENEKETFFWLRKLGCYFYLRGNSEKAADFFHKASKKAKLLYGEKSIYYVDTLIKLSRVLSQGDKLRAIALLDEASKIAKLNLYALQLLNTSYLYRVLGDRKKASLILEYLCENLGKIFEKKPREYVRFINLITRPMYGWQLGVDIREKMLLDAQNDTRKLFGANSREFANNLKNLASIYSYYNVSEKVKKLYKAGRNKKATEVVEKKQIETEDLYYRALAIDRNLLARDGAYGVFSYINTLSQLADYYSARSSTGQFLAAGMGATMNSVLAISLTEDRLLVKAASKLYEYLLSVTESVCGKKDPTILDKFAYHIARTGGRGHEDRAINLLCESGKIKRALYGEKSPVYMSSMLQIGQLYLRRYYSSKEKSEFRKAEKYLQKYTEMVRRFYGANSLQYANALEMCSKLYQGIDKKASLKFAQESVKIKENLKGKLSLDYQIVSLESSAAHYLGVEHNYQKSLSIYEKVLELKEKLYGEDSEQYYLTLKALASIHEMTKNYGKAIPLCKKILKKDKKDVNTIGMLVRIYIDLGEYDRAGELVQQLESYLKGTGASSQSLDIASSYENIGDYCLAIGHYEEAIDNYRNGLQTLKKGFNMLNIEAIPYFGTHKLFGMAKAFQHLGKFREAERLLKQVVNAEENPAEGIMINYNVDTDPDHLEHITALGDFEYEMDHFEEAQKNYMLVASRLKDIFGARHPTYSSLLSKLGLTSVAMGELDKAFDFEKLSLQTLNNYIKDLSLWASSATLESYLLSTKKQYDLFYSLLGEYFVGSGARTVEALNTHLNSKGRIAEALATRHRISLFSSNPKLFGVIRELKDILENLSHLTLCPPSNMSAKDFRSLLSDLVRRKQELEEELARQSAKYAEALKVNEIDTQKLVETLPIGGAYLDIIEYERYDFKKRGWTNTRYYLGFLLTRTERGKASVEIQNLGKAEKIDALVSELRKVLRGEIQSVRGVAGIRAVGKLEEKVDLEERIHQIGSTIFERVLGPFEDKIAKIRMLYISPDGILNILPFEVLTIPKTCQYLCTQIPVVYAMGKDLCAEKTDDKPDVRKGTDKSIILVAAPDFEIAKSTTNEKTKDKLDNQVETLSRGLIKGWPVKFADLPGTLEEVEAIKKIGLGRKVIIYKKTLATEANVKRINDPQILHLATHGFFLPDVSGAESGGKTKYVSDDGIAENFYAIGEKNYFRGKEGFYNPLLRSGLALAGANRLAENRSIPKGQDDGILTAAEVTGMDLYGTDLVVLSACETGIGEIQRGEGVAGLRRAFKIAGARNIIMSLWDVPDRETVWLMKDFYLNYFRGDSPALALNKARAALRNKLVEIYGRDPAYYWGAFILEGCAR